RFVVGRLPARVRRRQRRPRRPGGSRVQALGWRSLLHCTPLGTYARCRRRTTSPTSYFDEGRIDRPRPPLHHRGRPGSREQVRLIAKHAAQLSMASPPRLEASGERIEKTGFRKGSLFERRPSEEAGAQLGIPTDVVPSTALIFEESGQQQTLSCCRF